MQISESDIIFEKPFDEFLKTILSALSINQFTKEILPKTPLALEILNKKDKKERLEFLRKKMPWKKIFLQESMKKE